MNDRSARRSRTFWPEPLTKAGVGAGHTHDVRPGWKVVGSLAVLLMVANTALVGWLIWLLFLSSDYAAQERQEERERVFDAICDVLEQFPPSPLGDAVRAKYGCGPGRPVEDFPPEVQRQLEGQAASSVSEPAAPAPVVPDPPVGSPAQPERPGGTPEPPPPAEPEPEPSPDPLEPSPVPADPLAPITETVCDLTDLCLEVPLP